MHPCLSHPTFSVEKRRAFRAQWATLARDKSTRKQLQASDHLIRCLVLGIPLTRQFSRVTSAVKLQNGSRPYQGAYLAAQPYPMRTAFSKWSEILDETDKSTLRMAAGRQVTDLLETEAS